MTAPASPGHRLGTAWLTVTAFVAACARSFANRRRIGPLFELSDRELHDIGLTRDDLRAALSQPLPRDPSVVLMVRAVDRRSRARPARTRLAGADLTRELAD